MPLALPALMSGNAAYSFRSIDRAGGSLAAPARWQPFKTAVWPVVDEMKDSFQEAWSASQSALDALLMRGVLHFQISACWWGITTADLAQGACVPLVSPGAKFGAQSTTWRPMNEITNIPLISMSLWVTVQWLSISATCWVGGLPPASFPGWQFCLTSD